MRAPSLLRRGKVHLAGTGHGESTNISPSPTPHSPPRPLDRERPGERTRVPGGPSHFRSPEKVRSPPSPPPSLEPLRDFLSRVSVSRKSARLDDRNHDARCRKPPSPPPLPFASFHSLHPVPPPPRISSPRRFFCASTVCSRDPTGVNALLEQTITLAGALEKRGNLATDDRRRTDGRRSPQHRLYWIDEHT